MQQKKTSEAIPNKRLKEQRELRGWTQEDLAEKVGASPVTVSRWENGTLPSLYHRSKLCKIFRKTPHELGFIQEAADDTNKNLAHQPLFSQEMATLASTRLPDNPANFQSLTWTLENKGSGQYTLGHITINGPEGGSVDSEAKEHIATLWPFAIPSEPYYPLPGRERDLNQLLTMLEDVQSPSIIVIDGLGGLGKTSLAVELARRALRQRLFKGVVGDSAQQEFFTGGEIVQIHDTSLDFDHLLDTIARQLGRWELPTLKLEEKLVNLANLFRQHRYLILVDNLETAESATALIAHLRSLLSASKAIVTSRKKVPHDFVHSLSLRELELEDSLFFLEMDMQQHNTLHLLHVPKERLIEIHEVTGGAPLAMKLVAAQARFLDLDVVLRQLRQASGNLYTYLFRTSWERLSSIAQRILIYIGRTVMTTVSWEELSSVGIAEDEGKLVEAVNQLVAYSLLDVASAEGQKRYGIHQLTRQFVNGELPKIWREQGLK